MVKTSPPDIRELLPGGPANPEEFTRLARMSRAVYTAVTRREITPDEHFVLMREIMERFANAVLRNEVLTGFRLDGYAVLDLVGIDHAVMDTLLSGVGARILTPPAEAEAAGSVGPPPTVGGAAPVPAPPDDFLAWLHDEIATRFVGASPPSDKDSAALWRAAKGDRDLIVDALALAQARATRNPILYPARWAAAVLRREDPADLHRRAEQVRRRREALS